MTEEELTALRARAEKCFSGIGFIAFTIEDVCGNEFEIKGGVCELITNVRATNLELADLLRKLAAQLAVRPDNGRMTNE